MIDSIWCKPNGLAINLRETKSIIPPSVAKSIGVPFKSIGVPFGKVSAYLLDGGFYFFYDFADGGAGAEDSYDAAVD